jgi:hypothetical protein
MNQNEIDAKRTQVEQVYAERVRYLNEERAQLDAWRGERLKALELISGDHWLELPGVAEPLAKTNQHSVLAAPPVARAVDGTTETMANVVRSAIAALKRDFTKKTVEEWLKENRPDMTTDALSGAIRTTLWKMKKDKKLVELGKIGNYFRYALAEESPTPSGVKDMLG